MTLRSAAALFAPRGVRGLLLLAVGGAAVVACADDGSSSPPLTGAAADGQALFNQKGCVGCHGGSGGGATVGPSLVGLWGTTITLDDGSTVTFDGDYVRNSVRDPDSQRPEGDWMHMPMFDERQLTDDELSAIVAYLEALGSS